MLYAATGGSDGKWVNSGGWRVIGGDSSINRRRLEDSPPCGGTAIPQSDNLNGTAGEWTIPWYGITCTPGGRVQSIELGGNNLIGTLPAGLSALASATGSLAFDNNMLSGTVSVELGEFEHLRGRFTLQDNRFSGSIPSQLGRLSRVKDGFNLFWNSLSGSIPVELSYITSQDCSISSNYVGSNALLCPVPVALQGTACASQTYCSVYAPPSPPPSPPLAPSPRIPWPRPPANPSPRPSPPTPPMEPLPPIAPTPRPFFNVGVEALATGEGLGSNGLIGIGAGAGVFLLICGVCIVVVVCCRRKRSGAHKGRARTGFDDSNASQRNLIDGGGSGRELRVPQPTTSNIDSSLCWPETHFVSPSRAGSGGSGNGGCGATTQPSVHTPLRAVPEAPIAEDDTPASAEEDEDQEEEKNLHRLRGVTRFSEAGRATRRTETVGFERSVHGGGQKCPPLQRQEESSSTAVERARAAKLRYKPPPGSMSAEEADRMSTDSRDVPRPLSVPVEKHAGAFLTEQSSRRLRRQQTGILDAHAA
jgi:hypothetical protein